MPLALRLLLPLAAVGAVAASPQARKPFTGRPETFRHYWEFRGTDCYPGIELGNCSDTHPPPYTIQECKRACLENTNCGGFNLPSAPRSPAPPAPPRLQQRHAAAPQRADRAGCRGAGTGT